MTNRHALLIGVPRYEDPELDDARLGAAVTADVAAMRVALEQSDYVVSDCGLDEVRGEATPTRIRRAIKTACATAPVGGVLLIYFSGHGITIDGQDFLIPIDAYRSDIPSDVDSLVPVIPTESLTSCRAGLVVFFVDACRSDPAQMVTSTPTTLSEPGGQLPFLAGGGHFVLVMGCGTGQLCQYDETGSAFTQSLAKVLDARNPARTLTEVIEEVTGDLARRSRQSQGASQQPVVRYPEVLRLAGETTVCDGDERAAAWRKAVEQSPLLALCENPEQVHAVVANCARRCGYAEDTLRVRTGLVDPWTDQDYPARVLRNVEFLLSTAFSESEAQTDRSLRSGEAALLITAPFLREAALAVGVQDAAGIDPANLERTYIPGLRGDLELTHEMHQHLVRRADGLRKRARARSDQADVLTTSATDLPTDGGQVPEAIASDQLALWLVHQWLNGRTKLWDEAGAMEVYALGRSVARPDLGPISDAEALKLVTAVLLAVGAEPADERVLTRLKAAYVSEHWRLVAAVLWLSGTMAADLRRLPPVVPDLLGTGMELPFTDIQDAAGRRVEWSRLSSEIIDLRLVCEHPALHDAFESIVRRAARAATTIHAELRLPPSLASRLPQSFTATGLRPATKSEDEPVYAVPLSRFQIAEEKVRELLMGKQLYGDPSLAIRELYQNALDACRWRQTREDYRLRKFGDPVRWTGLIRFAQGIDETGRPFIECVDNGVGMDLNTLKHVFANAGERFVYGQDFRAEQAGWAELNPPLRLVSNSQFGVGVFSYFMLADEITVTTRHQRREGGVASEAHEVRIASSGSLIQISQAQGELPEGGTRLRLYLGGDVTDVSVLRTLRDLLWVAEYRVEVKTPEGQQVWEPGELRGPNGTVPPLHHGRDVWWVAEEGGIAADGIKTGEDFYGLVINLRDEHRPQFTVDRNKLRSWDKEWVDQQIQRSLPDLTSWPGFTLSWLWKVSDSTPAIGQKIYEHAVAIGLHVKIGETWGKSARVSLNQAGCLANDYTLFTRYDKYFARWFSAWRSGAWANLVAVPTSRGRVPIARRTEGFPVPDSVDSDLLERLDVYDEDAPPTPGRLLEALATRGHTVLGQLRRIRRYAITGLDISAARRVPPVNHLVEADDVKEKEFATLLSAFAAWSEAEEPRKICSAGPLLRTSYTLSLPLGEVLRRLGRLTPADWSISMPELGDLANHTCTQDEARLLALDNEFYQRWPESDIGPAHLAQASDELGRSLNEIIKICDRFLPLGVKVAKRDAYPEDLDLIESVALHYVPEPGQSISPIQLVYIAGRAGASVGMAYDGLDRLERLGILIRPEVIGPRDLTPTRQDLIFIENNLRGKFSRSMRRTYQFSERPWAILASLIEDEYMRESELQIAERLSPFMAPSEVISCQDLVRVAYGNGTNDRTIGKAAEAIQSLYADAQLPEISEDCSDLTVPWQVARTLGGYIGWGDGDFDAATIIDSMLYSRILLGDFFDQLAAFRPLGAAVIKIDGDARRALNQVKIDEYDLDMLLIFDGFGDDTYMRTISALTLVQTAGRIGWSLAEAHKRFARLVPIGLTLEYPQVDFPDETVRVIQNSP